MLSVLKHTKTPVKFWFLKNYLSPQVKVRKFFNIFENAIQNTLRFLKYRILGIFIFYFFKINVNFVGKTLFLKIILFIWIFFIKFITISTRIWVT